jgi:uncharacterized protein
MYPREIANVLLEYAQSFRAVLVTGPRQAGKTTLVQQCFPEKPYVSLENPDERDFALNDPRAYLGRFPNGAILDEVQRVPTLFNYLQEILDKENRDGLYILTGSNNILLQDNVSQTLAGRLGILELMPVSYREMYANAEPQSLIDSVWKGGYPEVHARNRNPSIWYPAYIRTYVERDVRQLRNIEKASAFTNFIRLCAGRIGQQINISTLSNDSGLDIRTIQAWLSILEASFVIYLLPPYYQNFNKRLIKTPKLYFQDTGLACSLLGIRKAQEMAVSHFKGALVENYIISECMKNNLNTQSGYSFYYWRDHKGVEVDLIREGNQEISLIEIKSAQTYTRDFAKNIQKLQELMTSPNAYILYDGEQEYKTSENIHIQNWQTFLKEN